MLVDAWCQIADEIRGELEESGRFTEDWEDHVDWKAYEAEAEVLARYEWDRACDYGDAWAAENACRVESSNRIMERLAG